MKIRTMMMAMLAVLAMVNLAACSDSDEEVDNPAKAVGYEFELVFTRVGGTDHADIINTTYSYMDYQGEKVENTYKEKFASSFTIKSQIYKKIPGTLTVHVIEALKPDVELTKEVYTLGLGLNFTIRSLTEDGLIIDSKQIQEAATITVNAADLQRAYPETTEFSFKIDADGKITNL